MTSHSFPTRRSSDLGMLDPGGMLSKQKKGTGKRLTSQERAKLRKQREKEERRRAREKKNQKRPPGA
jgi:hypothetical protein